MRHVTIATVLLGIIVSFALGDVSFSIEYTSYAFDLVGGYHSSDLILNTTTDWTRSILLVEPNVSGEVYQDGFGWIVAPGVILMFGPNWHLYDTFISDGVDFGLTYLTIEPDVTLPGGTTVPFVFDANELAVEYYNTNTEDTGPLFLARVTLDEAANGGSWRFIGWTAEGGDAPMVDVSGGIQDGFLVIPEPVSLSLMAIGGIALLRRKHR